jgi:hypothetical protein
MAGLVDETTAKKGLLAVASMSLRLLVILR